MHKFKIGDLVTAIPGTGYTITNTSGVYEVEDYLDQDMIAVRVVRHERETFIGSSYPVIESNFFLVFEEKESDDPVSEDDLSLLFS